MWNWLYPGEQGIRPIQVALNTNKVNGHGKPFLPSPVDTNSSYVEGHSELTSLLEVAGTTAPPHFQGHCLLVHPLVAIRPGFGGGMTARLEL